jgi:hypothetical protein
VVGRAAAVLSTRTRGAAAFAVLLAALLAYYVFHDALPDLSRWGDIAFLSLVLIPAAFGLVGLALPVRRWRGLLPVGLAVAVLAALCELGSFDIAANFLKLAAVTMLGFWFLSLFETVWWAVLVACIVPLVDAYSVWRGPTRHIVEEREEIFTTLSLAFPVWGHEGSANLGLPDLLFFAVFLAAAARWDLRVWLTWLCMALSFGATLAIAVWGEFEGLPALPILCLGFLAPNADLLVRRYRERGHAV